MSQFIELQRSRLEEIDVIRQATFKRFRKNPEIIPQGVREKDDILSIKATRPHKETILQKHEVSQFKDRYDYHVKSITTLNRDLVKESLDKITDNNKDFKQFDSLFESISRQPSDSLNSQHEDLGSIYSMYSSSPISEVQATKKGKFKVKRKFILSEEAIRRLNVDTLFSPEEAFGKNLDLRALHEQYVRLIGKKVSYIEYLRSFHSPTFVEFPSANRNDYEQYIRSLWDYIDGFFKRANPLNDMNSMQKAIEEKFKAETVVEEPEKKDGNPNENGEVYCKACDKVFNKESVYKGHLEGKKHKKNIKRMEEQEQPSKLLESQEIEKNTGNDLRYIEFKIQYLAELLKETIEDTINNVERQEAMTEREKIIELNEIAGDESEYTTANSEPSEDSDNQGSDDEDEDREMFKQLPTGIDGAPIPFWLYKLQGLHHTYNCEICGNLEYKGRVAFEKHFGSPKHQQGLKFLGIDSQHMKLFANITNINEALELWDAIKKQERSQVGEVQDSIEVEDNEGNVMSESDYIELKKQGII